MLFRSYLNPYGITPLCAYLLFHTNKKYAVRYTVLGDLEENNVTSTVWERKQRHRIPVFGLYAGRINSVVVELLDENENTVEKTTIDIQTEELPQVLEDVVKVVEHKQPMLYNLTLVSGKSTYYPYAFDSAGEVRYYLKARPKGYGLIPLSGGKYIYVDRKALCPTSQLPHATTIYEMDLLGRFYHTFYVPNGSHHDFCEVGKGGNLLTISNSIEEIGRAHV